jgi:hypothetical protein
MPDNIIPNETLSNVLMEWLKSEGIPCDMQIDQEGGFTIKSTMFHTVGWKEPRDENAKNSLRQVVEIMRGPNTDRLDIFAGVTVMKGGIKVDPTSVQAAVYSMGQEMNVYENKQNKDSFVFLFKDFIMVGTMIDKDKFFHTINNLLMTKSAALTIALEGSE